MQDVASNPCRYYTCVVVNAVSLCLQLTSAVSQWCPTPWPPQQKSQTTITITLPGEKRVWLIALYVFLVSSSIVFTQKRRCIIASVRGLVGTILLG